MLGFFAALRMTGRKQFFRTLLWEVLDLKPTRSGSEAVFSSAATAPSPTPASRGLPSHLAGEGPEVRGHVDGGAEASLLPSLRSGPALGKEGSQKSPSSFESGSKTANSPPLLRRGQG